MITVWLGSHAIYYSLISPTYSHAASMLTSTWFFSYWLRHREALSRQRAAALGALAGLAALMRWQDAIFLAIPAIEIWHWRTAWAVRLGALAAAGAGAIVAFSPQMIVWQTLYGQPLAVPQGPSFMRWTAPHLVDVLFSTNHGLFTWAPVLLVAVAGLVALSRRDRRLAFPLAVVFITTWYVNAAVADWWAGEAYGARRFLSLFPLFVVGTACWLQDGRPSVRLLPARLAIAAAFIVANGLLLLQYELFMKGFREIAPYPGGWPGMWVDRFAVPFRLIAWLLR